MRLEELGREDRWQEVARTLDHEPLALVRQRPRLEAYCELHQQIEELVLEALELSRLAEPAEAQAIMQCRQLRDHAEQLRVPRRPVQLPAAVLALVERERLRPGLLLELVVLECAEEVVEQALELHEKEPGLDVEPTKERRVEVPRVAPQPYLGHHCTPHQLLPPLDQQVPRVHAPAYRKGEQQRREVLQQDGRLLQLRDLERVCHQELHPVLKARLVHQEQCGAHERVCAGVQPEHVEHLESLAVQVPRRPHPLLQQEGTDPKKAS